MSEITISEASRQAQVSRQTIYNKIKSGTLTKLPSGNLEREQVALVYPKINEPKMFTDSDHIDNKNDVKFDNIKVLYALLDERAQRINELKAQISDLKAENDRLRNAGGFFKRK